MHRPRHVGVSARADQVVELRVPAAATQLPVVRAVANTLAMRADFDIDAISDVTMAVDELCSQLMTRATADASLCCVFSVLDEDFVVHGSVPTAGRAPQSDTSFGWRVLTTLVDSAHSWLEDSGRAAELHIEAVKARTAGDVRRE